MNSNTTLEEVWALFRETDRKMQETDRRLKDLAEESKERQRETDRQLRELGQQIGGLGNKFGSFTEGLALPSMEKILRRRFGVDTIAPSVRVSRGGQHLELDVLAYANGAVRVRYIAPTPPGARFLSNSSLRRQLHDSSSLIFLHSGFARRVIHSFCG